MSREDEDHGPASFARVASGFVRLPADFEPGSQDLKRLLIQVDGQDDSTSVDVTHLGINTADATAPWIMDGTALAAISGNTVVFADASPDWSPTETWIITFEDLPA